VWRVVLSHVHAHWQTQLLDIKGDSQLVALDSSGKTVTNLTVPISSLSLCWLLGLQARSCCVYQSAFII
jgi:hypothetical protein